MVFDGLSKLDALVLPLLEKVVGAARIHHGGASVVAMQALSLIGDDFEITDDSAAETFYFPSLTTVTGNLRIAESHALWDFSGFPRLGIQVGSLELRDNRRLVSLAGLALGQVGSAISLVRNPTLSLEGFSPEIRLVGSTTVTIADNDCLLDEEAGAWVSRLEDHQSTYGSAPGTLSSSISNNNASGCVGREVTANFAAGELDTTFWNTWTTSACSMARRSDGGWHLEQRCTNAPESSGAGIGSHLRYDVREGLEVIVTYDDSLVPASGALRRSVSFDLSPAPDDQGNVMQIYEDPLVGVRFQRRNAGAVDAWQGTAYTNGIAAKRLRLVVDENQACASYSTSYNGPFLDVTCLSMLGAWDLRRATVEIGSWTEVELPGVAVTRIRGVEIRRP